MIERAEAGLFLDPGLGKTSSTLGAFTILKKKKMVRRALILAPLRVAQAVWPEEIKKWKDFEHLRVVVLHGPDKDKLVQLAEDMGVKLPRGATKAIMIDLLTRAEVEAPAQQNGGAQ